MAQFQYAFIVKAPGYNLGEKNTDLVSDEFRTNVIGVGSLEEAFSAAKKLVEKGVTLIELCSGFKKDDAEQIHTAISGQAKVGFVGEFYPKND